MNERDRQYYIWLTGEMRVDDAETKSMWNSAWDAAIDSKSASPDSAIAVSVMHTTITALQAQRSMLHKALTALVHAARDVNCGLKIADDALVWNPMDWLETHDMQVRNHALEECADLCENIDNVQDSTFDGLARYIRRNLKNSKPTDTWSNK